MSLSSEKSPCVFCGDGRQLPAVGARRAWRGGELWGYRARMCQGEGMWAARQKDTVPALAFLRLKNNMGRRKEKQSGEEGSPETTQREGEKQLPVAKRFQVIIADFGLKPSFQPCTRAEVNLSDVIFIRTHHMRRPAVTAGPLCL